jgi:hypothetical protein
MELFGCAWNVSSFRKSRRNWSEEYFKSHKVGDHHNPSLEVSRSKSVTILLLEV